MKVLIYGHSQYLATQELDYPMDKPQEEIYFRLSKDRSADGLPVVDLTGKPPRNYQVLEYVLIQSARNSDMPCYQFRSVLKEK